MLNQIILVGRLTKDIKVKEGENGSKWAILSLAIPRSFKNADGEYETDFVDCKCFDSIASNTAEYCRKGDIVGVKGRIQSTEVEKYHQKEMILEIIAEKVTFLSSKPKNDEE